MIVNEPRAAPEGRSAPDGAALSELEIALLLEGLSRLSGFDFREYAPTALRRRIAERVRAEGVATVTGLLERAIHDAAACERLIFALSAAPPIAPFRDATFFREIATDVVPRLRTYPFVRVWVAGCGNGADAYALAILLAEAGLATRAHLRDRGDGNGDRTRARGEADAGCGGRRRRAVS